MSGLVILNGNFESDDFLKELSQKSSFVVCADGGYRHAERAGIIPNVIVGDFDSLETSIPKISVKSFPKNKNLTDGEIAVEEVLSQGIEEVIITCALGGRTDHEISNIMLLKRYPKAVIMGENVTIKGIGEKYILSGLIGKTVSIIPIEESVVTLKGFLYPLEKKKLKLGTTLTMSNVVKSNLSEIIVSEGFVFAFINK